VTSEQFVQDVLAVEIDADVAAVWQTILSAADGEWLANRILTYNLTSTNVETLLHDDPHTVRERAFHTIVRNRINRGGILAPGAGLLKFGEAGKGILSRWYPETLARRIRRIIAMRSNITFIHGDGLPVLAEHINDPDAVFFIDPPYTAGKNGKRAGQRLYAHNDVDHEQLFDYVSHIQGDFLMTYDNAEEVRSLARRYNMDTRLVPMRNTHHASMKELVIGRNLDWVTLPQPESDPMP
jgi:DNA adenine methylase